MSSAPAAALRSCPTRPVSSMLSPSGPVNRVVGVAFVGQELCHDIRLVAAAMMRRVSDQVLRLVDAVKRKFLRSNHWTNPQRPLVPEEIRGLIVRPQALTSENY